jgi:CRP/FNR family transcriptional regulator
MKKSKKRNPDSGTTLKSAFPSWTCENCPAHLSGIFADLTLDQMREVEKGRVLDQYKRGQILYYEGHHPLAAYCLLAGQVKVYRALADGQHRILRLAGPGDLLGHESLLKKDAYEANAEVMKDTYVCTLPRGAVLPILEKNPGTLLRLLEKVTEDLKQLQGAGASDRGRQPVSVRMAHLLLDLNQRLGRPVHWGSSIELPLSRSEMASMLGTTTETAIRVLNRFQAQGILTLGHHTVDLKNIQALRDLVQ